MSDAVDRFQNLWTRIGGRSPSNPFPQLFHAYSEPQRAYHNLTHICDCLEQLDSASNLAMQPDELEYAIWFHDAIYDPKAADNEERSAEWAVRSLHETAVDDSFRNSVSSLIMATKQHQATTAGDCELLLDIDLSILGRSLEEFSKYDRAIRKEYDWVPEQEYFAGRLKVLETFLNRPAIYFTRTFRDRYEASARRNLRSAIGQLCSRLTPAL